ncbi:hypothetical protein OG21DRAFT_261389 [Imleria badia]|nr:hypothetical protein OG21DRAFT_261389 [Imleria badia]
MLRDGASIFQVVARLHLDEKFNISPEPRPDINLTSCLIEDSDLQFTKGFGSAKATKFHMHWHGPTVSYGTNRRFLDYSLAFLPTMLGLGQRILPLPSLILGGIGAGCIVTLILGGTTVLAGNMLKFQAQYVPKSLAPRYLNKDVMASGLIATTYWDLLKRVYGLEVRSLMQFNGDHACQLWIQGTPGLLRGMDA